MVSKVDFSFVSELVIKHNAVKRAFDIGFSLFILLFLSPLFLFLSLLIFISSPGSVVYRHERIGRKGKVIKCLKFRTMCHNADKKLEILLKNKELKQEWVKYFKLKNDPRILPIGKFLRKTSLDELPQFWNVLKGDLSVVGPRPCVAEEVKKYFKDKAPKILSVRPGITGLWQTSGRNQISWAERIKIEEFYVDNHSFYMDIKLICKTVPSMIFSKGAY